MRQLTCPVCGVFRTSKGPCLNKIQCRSREDETATVLAHSPLNIHESPLQRRDIFMLLRSEEEINTLMEARNTELPSMKQRRFRDMLGVSALAMDALHEIRTLV